MAADVSWHFVTVNLVGSVTVAHIEDFVDRLREGFDKDVGVVLMLHFFEFGGYLRPVVDGIEQRYEVVEVEVSDGHVVDAFGLDAAVGTGQTDFAYFGKHLLVFLVKHIFIEEEGNNAVAETVPHGCGR